MRPFYWPLFLVFTLLVRAVFQHRPEWAENVYSRGFFPAFRNILDFLTAWLPFPFTYWVFGAVLWTALYGIRKLIRRKDVSLRRKLSAAGLGLLNFLCGLTAVFYWVWGFNYNRVAVESRLEIPLPAPVPELLADELSHQTALVLDLRKKLQPDTVAALPDTFSLRNMETEVRRCVREQLAQFEYPTPGNPRGRQPFWPGFLLRFGAAGIYHPFSGESNIDRGLHPLTKPYNLAHEFAHAYGFGDEGVCNFLGYWALKNAPQPYFRYSAELGYWRELASAYRRVDPERYARLRAELPPGFIADLENIYRALDRYPEFFEAFRKKAYDEYLKAQGIGEGMANYGKMIPLVTGLKSKQGDLLK